MKIKLIKYDNENIVAKAARLCYFSSTIDELEKEMNDEKCARLIKKLKSLNHQSPFEHVSYTFGIEGVSRACMAQITRHRLASYSIKSQRYVKESGFEYIIPKSITENNIDEMFISYMEEIQRMYNRLIELGIKKEESRMVLPNACETKIIMTINARSLQNFFNLRRKKDAQWEIRNLANEMYSIVKEIHPNIWSYEK